MANINTPVNKVVFGGETIVDLTKDTVAANKMLSGYTAHDKNGQQIQGSIGYVQLTGTDLREGFVMGAPAGEPSRFQYFRTKDSTLDIPIGYNQTHYEASIDADEKAKLIPENIKAGVTILGVQGSVSEQTEDIASGAYVVTTEDAATLMEIDDSYPTQTPVIEKVETDNGNVLMIVSPESMNDQQEQTEVGVEVYVSQDEVLNALEVEPGIDTSDATATAADIVSPKTAYVNGEKITGGIERVSEINISENGYRAIGIASGELWSNYIVPSSKANGIYIPKGGRIKSCVDFETWNFDMRSDRVTYPQGPMTGANTLNCQVSAQTTYSSSYPAYYAFNYNVGNSWSSASSSNYAPVRLQIKLPEALSQIEVNMFSRKQNNPASPGTGFIYGSNNPSTEWTENDWVEIGSFKGFDKTKSDGSRHPVVYCKNTEPYQYVRILFTDYGTASYKYCALGMIYISGLPQS